MSEAKLDWGTAEVQNSKLTIALDGDAEMAERFRSFSATGRGRTIADN
jgi:hypothetical protein